MAESMKGYHFRDYFTCLGKVLFNGDGILHLNGVGGIDANYLVSFKSRCPFLGKHIHITDVPFDNLCRRIKRNLQEDKRALLCAMISDFIFQFYFRLTTLLLFSGRYFLSRLIYLLKTVPFTIK